MTEDLIERIDSVALAAAEDAATPSAAAAFRELSTRLHGPIRLAIAGKVKAGKSTLLNALIGEELAPTDAGECTQILTWYRYADRPYARLHPHDAAPEERPFTRHDGALEVDLNGRDASQVDHLEIGWPTRRLTDLVLIDTPGIGSLSTNVSARTSDALSAESGGAPVADAVLYLLRHTHASDIRFLEAFHDDIARRTPVNTIGVLSRADELGSSLLDAMEVAARIARRYESNPRLHRLCPVVVPVNGLLGHAAATLRESEYAAVRALAQAPKAEVDELLLTADRFATMSATVAINPEQRSDLLDRLGLFGVRLAVEMVRAGTVSTSSDLADLLTGSSGLEGLRRVVLIQFERRARVLKARSVVAALQGLLADRGGGGDLVGRLEQVTSSAHEFEEVRILLELRSGELSLPEARMAQLDLLMGGSGHDSASRLGLPADASAEQIRSATLDGLRTWQGVERHPLSSRDHRIAARAATRTLEGFLSVSTDAPPDDP